MIDCSTCGGVDFHYEGCPWRRAPFDSEVFLTDQKRLELMRFSRSWRVKHSEDYDIDFNMVIHRFEADILTEHLASDFYEKQVLFHFPATTWQMFKSTHAESWWLGWLVRRRPVKTQTFDRTAVIKVDRYVKYPESTIQFKELGRPIPYETIKEVQ